MKLKKPDLTQYIGKASVKEQKQKIVSEVLNKINEKEAVHKTFIAEDAIATEPIVETVIPEQTIETPINVVDDKVDLFAELLDKMNAIDNKVNQIMQMQEEAKKQISEERQFQKGEKVVRKVVINRDKNGVIVDADLIEE